ncbi:hypothetical protein ACH0CP_16615 [Sphingomonas sp. 179-I 2A4 NHS]|uniref:hypothetical protein n=1 Tax=unclassified Sphingomonas TaxID=196159 RepID=UPI003879A564
MGVTVRASLLAGLTWAVAVPAAAQQPPPLAAQTGSSRAATAELPVVEPRSTAAAPLAVTPVASTRAPAGPRDYRPDQGGPLSGLPYDRRIPKEAPPAPAPVPVHTLGEAIALAYRTNPQLLAARGIARATDYRVPQARSAFGPQCPPSAPMAQI